jgi:hypothetical protein
MKTYYLYSGRVSKLPDVKWFKEEHEAESNERIKQLKDLNLAASWTVTVEDDDNWVYQVYFETSEKMTQFLSYNRSLVLNDMSKEYNSENGIIDDVLFSGPVEIEDGALPVSNV